MFGKVEECAANLQRNQGLFESYDQVIQEQLAEGVVEKFNDKQEFYLPHKAVICENVESTKLQIVYNASARENSKILTLNDCLEIGHAPQNLLWNIYTGTRFKPIALCDDLQKAFLQNLPLY